jgi:hypothetical protein
MSFPSFGRFTGGPTTPPEPAQSNNDPRESFTPGDALLNTGSEITTPACPAVEIVTKDSTLSIFEEAEAEAQLTTRGEAKKLISERLKERNRLRMLLEKSESELAKLLKKTPEEIAALRY